MAVTSRLQLCLYQLRKKKLNNKSLTAPEYTLDKGVFFWLKIAPYEGAIFILEGQLRAVLVQEKRPRLARLRQCHQS